MDQLTTYRVKGKTIGLVFLFKYDLNGNLKLFEVSEGELDDKQVNWLFRGFLPKDVPETLPFSTQKELNNYLVVRFPATENMFKCHWAKNKEMIQKFEIEKSPANLSFEALWNLYGYKESRKDAEKFFSKLTEADKIKCFIQVPKYKKKIALTGIAQALLGTWLNKQRFNDEY